MRVLMIIGLLFGIGSCTLFDSTDNVPMYFKVDEVALETSLGQGLNTHKINDLSVYADGFSIGVYPLPTDIPVIQTKEDIDVVLFGVVRNNGVASNPVEYPFYDAIRYEFPFMGGEVKTLNPVFNYSNQTKVIQVANFESSNEFSIHFDQNSDISFVRSAETPYGNFCGKISLSQDQLFFEKTTFSKIERQDVVAGSIFLEMDYKNEIPFSVGILGIQSSGLLVPNYKVQLAVQEEWNKIYIELTQLLTDNLNEEFTIILKSLNSNTSTGSIWIDNLRVLHF